MTAADKAKATKQHLFLRLLGPGLVTGAADDDPSGIATYSQAGAQFGYALLWTVFLTTPFMIAIQLISAQIGRVTGQGIVGNVNKFYPRSLVFALVALVLVANIFNIAADLAAMGTVLELVVGGLRQEHALIFAAVSVLLQVFVPYRHYAPILKYLTLVLFCYVGTAFIVDVPWSTALLATLWPKPEINSDYLMMVVAVLGTTISPYLFFWQAAQEVEELRMGRKKAPLKALTRGGKGELDRIMFDTTAGMIFSNLIAYFIIVASAATLHAHGHGDVRTAAEAAEALRPIAGDLAFALFALGIIGTGLLAVPVLAGSAAYCVAAAFDWRASLEVKPMRAVGFNVIIAAATLVGLGLSFSSIDPIRMLVWSAILNGVVAVPIMVVMMMVASNASLMGRFKIHGGLLFFGWGAAALMGMGVAAMLVSLVL
jgi:NRAMP (natural resistance-associated macrophage protein)-like metal ion transporter